MPFSFTRAALASLSILMMVACSSSETEDPTIVAGEEHPGGGIDPGTVSYTHLTLPTIHPV